MAGKLCHLIGSWLGLFLRSTSILREGRSCSTRLSSSLWSLSSLPSSPQWPSLSITSFFFQKRTLSVAWSYRTFGKHERGISSFSQQGFTGLADCIFQHKKALVSKITSGISDGHISNDLPYPRPLKAGESSSTQTRVVHPSGRVLQE